MLDKDEFHEQFERFDPDNIIGRYVENYFGQKELVTMEKLYWDYFDWVDQVAGGFIHGKWWHEKGIAPLGGKDMIKQCSYFQKGATLSRTLRLWVDVEMKYRRNQKLPEPHWIEDSNIPDIPKY